MTKKVLVLGCNAEQINYIRELKVLGYTVIGTDLNGNAVGIDECHHFYNVGYTDYDALLKICEQHEFKSTDKIFTASCQHACLSVAILSKYLGIDYMSEESIKKCLSKVEYYKLFKYLKVPIPETITIFNQSHLNQTLNKFPVQNWYLKSDYSKNPNYIYKFNSVDDIDINWKRDQYFRDSYSLQPEFIGKHYRINLFYNDWNVYNFDVNDKTPIDRYQFNKLGIIKALLRVTEYLNIDKYLVKFDVIINGDNYVVLDIGLDRPYRMLLDIGKDFYRQYVNHYVNGVVNYGI